MKFTTNFLIRCLKNQIAACLREIKKGVKFYAVRINDLYNELEAAENKIRKEVIGKVNALATMTQVQCFRFIYAFKTLAKISQKIKLVDVTQVNYKPAYDWYYETGDSEYIVTYKIDDTLHTVTIDAGELASLYNGTFSKHFCTQTIINDVLLPALQRQGFNRAKVVELGWYDDCINLNPANYYAGTDCTYVGVTDNKYWMGFGKRVQDIANKQYFSKLSDLINAIKFQVAVI